MSIKHKIDKEFVSICQRILKENLELSDWVLIESSDQFQTDNYCGGFDGIENGFTFSYFDKDRKEFWFQLSLSDVNQVVERVITEIDVKEAEYQSSNKRLNEFVINSIFLVTRYHWIQYNLSWTVR